MLLHVWVCRQPLAFDEIFDACLILGLLLQVQEVEEAQHAAEAEASALRAQVLEPSSPALERRGSNAVAGAGCWNGGLPKERRQQTKMDSPTLYVTHGAVRAFSPGQLQALVRVCRRRSERAR